MTVRIGTSSWADPGFVADWYPPGLPASERLAYYAEHFDAVEVNATFYAVPSQSTVEGWDARTPEGFVFDVKLHKYLSRHSAAPDSLPKALRPKQATKRVPSTEELEAALLDAILEATEPLADAGKLGGFLAQMSPSFRPRENAIEELAPLVERLRPFPLALELRNRSWMKDPERTLADVEALGAVWVCVDAPDGDHFTIMPPHDAVTAPGLAYLRAHGRNAEGYVKGRSVAERFDHDYSDLELEEIAARVRSLEERAGEVRVYMNNNAGAYAPEAAARLKSVIAAAPPARASGAAGR